MASDRSKALTLGRVRQPDLTLPVGLVDRIEACFAGYGLWAADPGGSGKCLGYVGL